MIPFMNFFSCLRLPVDLNTWRAEIGLFGNVSMGSSIFYLTKCFIYILHSILLLIIISFLLFTVHFYDKDLDLMEYLSLHVDSTNVKGSFFSKFSNKCCTSYHVRILFWLFLFFISVILLVLSGDIETNLCPNPGYLNSFSFCH